MSAAAVGCGVMAQAFEDAEAVAVRIKGHEGQADHEGPAEIHGGRRLGDLKLAAALVGVRGSHGVGIRQREGKLGAACRAVGRRSHLVP